MTISIDHRSAEQKSARPPLRHDMPRWAWIVLALILVLAGALRYTMIGDPTYELDEYWHAELSTGRGSAQNHLPMNEIFVPGPRVTGLKDAPPIWKIWTHMEQTVHPPMYPIALRVWREIFGEGMTSSRSLGATASIISILILFDIVRRMHDIGAALWSAAIFAVSSPQISLSRTLRGYTFGLMLLLAVAWIVVRLIEDPPLRQPSKHRFKLIALALLTAATMLTHYFTVFPLAAIGIYAVIRLRGSLRWQAIGAMFIGAVLFFASWTPAMLEQRHTLPAPTDSWINDNWDGHVVRVLKWAAAIPARMLFEPRDEVAAFAILGASLYLIPLFLLRKRPRLILWSLWLWLVMLPLLLLDLTRGSKHVSFARYVLAAGPAVFALLAVLLQHARFASLRHVLPAVAFVACVLSIGSAYEEPRLRYDELAAFIDARKTPQEPIVVLSRTTVWYGNAIFLTLSYESKTYPWPMMLVHDMPMDPALIAQLRSRSKTAWLIYENWTMTPDAVIPGAKIIDRAWVPYVGAVWHVELPD